MPAGSSAYALGRKDPHRLLRPRYGAHGKVVLKGKAITRIMAEAAARKKAIARLEAEATAREKAGAVPVLQERSASLPEPDSQPDRGEVLTESVLRAADFLGLSDSQLEKVVGIAKGELSRLKRKKKPLEDGSMPFELATVLVRAHRSLNVIAGGDKESACAWMNAEIPSLGGRPIDMIMKVEGLIDVAAYLDERRVLA